MDEIRSISMEIYKEFWKKTKKLHVKDDIEGNQKRFVECFEGYYKYRMNEYTFGKLNRIFDF